MYYNRGITVMNMQIECERVKFMDISVETVARERRRLTRN